MNCDELVGTAGAPSYSARRYLLNVGSNGYANKLRYLFLCGSVVVWVRTGSLNHEFFERQARALFRKTKHHKIESSPLIHQTIDPWRLSSGLFWIQTLD